MRRRTQALLEHGLNFRIGREPSLPPLAEQHLVIELQLEDAVAGRHDLADQQGSVVTENLLEEADRFRQVVSGGAVGEPETVTGIDHPGCSLVECKSPGIPAPMTPAGRPS